MKAYEIFREIQPETATSVFQYLRDEQREVYTASLSTLAANRKLRPVFIQRKPGPAQIEWLVKNIKLKTSDEIAEHVIQLWLMKAHQEMLTQFLDGVGIEHDGEGAAEDIPDELDAKKLKTTVDQLLKDQDAEAVRIYLHVFQTQRPDGWTELTSLIESTPELQFGEAEPPAPAKEEKPAAKAEEAPAEEPEPAEEDSSEEDASGEEE
ncbi:MAG: hypothetical protein P1U85_12760 [Verrucomicrobiales bacterium]|nr:hypothetical protein [Verrucomicrobiales bacterium]